VWSYLADRWVQTSPVDRYTVRWLDHILSDDDTDRSPDSRRPTDLADTLHVVHITDLSIIIHGPPL